MLHDGQVVHDQTSPLKGGPPIPSIRALAAKAEAEEAKAEA
jgi:hypothetical protein